MSNHDNQIIFPQVPQNQLENIIKKRFANLPIEESLLPYPLFQEPIEAAFHPLLPSLSFQELISMQVKSRFFRWSNRGNKIGIEVNKEYILKDKKTFLQQKQYLEYLNNQIEEQINHFKALLNEPKTQGLNADEIKSYNDAIFSNENFKIINNQKLKMLDELLQQNFKKDYFIEITNIPSTINLKKNPKGKVILTYSFPKSLDNKLLKPFESSIIEQIHRIFADIPYLDFVFIDEDQDKIKAAIRIVQSDFLPYLNKNNEIITANGGTHFLNPFLGEPISIQLLSSLDPQELIHSLLHELMHAFGVPHHWDAIAAIDDQGNFKTDFKVISDDNMMNFLRDARKRLNTTFNYSLPDHSNEAYEALRDINNQTIRAISGAILSTMYHLEDPFPKGICFKFLPKIGAKFYSSKIDIQKDGSKIVTYSGRCSGITLSNPGADFTDFDFTDIPAFPTPPLGFYSGVHDPAASYPNGVTAYFGPDASITFYASDGFPNDKNVSIDLLTNNVRRIYLSKYDDSISISKIYKKVQVHPGLGNDVIQTFANNTTVVIGKYEDFDTIEMTKGGTILLGYQQKDLQYYYRGNDIYLLAVIKDMPDGVHGVGLKGYKTNKYATKIIIKDSSNQIINLKKKSFALLPE